MFTSWTSREKKLVLITGAVLIVAASLFFSTWINHTGEQDQVLRRQTYIPSHVLGGDLDSGRDAEAGRDVGNLEEAGEMADEQQTKHEKLVVIDIKGAVQKPGVYRLQEGERVLQALESAGGLTEQGTTLTINLAVVLSDGMVIYVPTLAEVEAEAAGEGYLLWSRASARQGGLNHAQDHAKININTASATELEKLSGIGASRALAIVHYRDEHDGFSEIAEIQNISGIGPTIFENIRDYITVK